MIVGEHWTRPYALIMPTTILVVGLLLYPAVANVYMALWDWNLLSFDEWSFVGISNYIRLFGSERFRVSFVFTLFFTFGSLFIAFVIGFSGALLLNGTKRPTTMVTALLMLPYMIAPIAVGLGWRLLLSRNYGLVTYLADVLLGIDPVPWLARPNSAILAATVAQAWRSFPFHMLLLLAGLRSIPQEFREAARVDGASTIREFVNITLPLLAPAISVVLIFETVFTLRVFELVISLTGGGPGVATTPLGLLVYEYSFRFLDGGVASALSVFMMVMGAIIGYIYFKFIYREVHY
jgi:multiple sugar transport system permease protein